MLLTGYLNLVTAPFRASLSSRQDFGDFAETGSVEKTGGPLDVLRYRVLYDGRPTGRCAGVLNAAMAVDTRRVFPLG